MGLSSLPGAGFQAASGKGTHREPDISSDEENSSENSVRNKRSAARPCDSSGREGLQRSVGVSEGYRQAVIPKVVMLSLPSVGDLQRSHGMQVMR